MRYEEMGGKDEVTLGERFANFEDLNSQHDGEPFHDSGNIWGFHMQKESEDLEWQSFFDGDYFDIMEDPFKEFMYDYSDDGI